METSVLHLRGGGLHCSSICAHCVTEVYKIERSIKKYWVPQKEIAYYYCIIEKKKVNHQQNQKVIYWVGRDIYKLYDR